MTESRGLITRPTWDNYFMSIAKVVATRSSCTRRQVGAILVVDKRVVATGYNGTPRGTLNCDEGGCDRCAGNQASGTALSECLCSHGEENAIVQSAYHGIKIKGATMYCTLQPCLTCTKMAINAGIERIMFDAEYPVAQSVLNLIKAAGMKYDRG